MSDEFDAYISPAESGLASLVTATETQIAVRATTPPPMPPKQTAVAPVPVAPATPAPAPSVPLPEGWTLHNVAALVGDVAANMYDLPFILKKHKLTDEQYKFLEKNPFYQRALEAEIITWQGANSAQKRLALEAAIASEAAMPVLAARLQSKSEPLSDIVSLMKLFSEMAGVTGNKAVAATGTGERVRITINLGGEDTMRKEAAVVIDQQALPAA